MCRQCDAPPNRYYLRDQQTGLIVCEICGFAIEEFTLEAVARGCAIWEANPAWPEYHSFDELVARLTGPGAVDLPPCRPLPNVPSRLLTYIYERLGQNLPEKPDPELPAGLASLYRH
ncbi:MAG: hypothetical protein KQJ78_15490 [Deltaproteobacteria bacterium]|nr:hypothetical protein [Deltaproteobacteria bacterium]